MSKEKKNKKPKAKSQKAVDQPVSSKKQSTVAERVNELRPIDDVMFHKLMEGEDGEAVCEEMLRVVLNDPKLSVLSVQPQEDMKNLYGRSVRLDALCTLGDGRICNIEVQKANNDNHFKRVRYNEACVTTNTTDPGEDFRNVPDVIMVYISDFDPFHAKRTIYHCYTVCEETGQKVDNGLTEIYLTTKGVEDGSLVKELMKCFNKPIFDHPSFPKLSKRMKHFKNPQGGFYEMCKIMEDYAKQYAEEYAEDVKSEAILSVQKDTIKSLISNGLNLESLTTLLPNYPKDLILEVYEEMRESNN